MMMLREKVIIFTQAGMLPKAGLEQVGEKSIKADMLKLHAEIAEPETQSA